MKNHSIFSFNLRSHSYATKRFLQEHFFTLVALFTFFLLVTAQTSWSTIHGDGAVYAWVTKEMALGGLLSQKLPNWYPTEVFAEHPYLFFYLSALFVKIFGVSDLALKLPNFIVAALSVFTLYKICKFKWNDQKGQQIGLIAGYALLLNATYIMQISQPSLDPMAQWLSLLGVFFFLVTKNSFLAGLALGAAFLTKGLELLPNMASLVLLMSFLQRHCLKTLLKNLLLFALGILLPVSAWLTFDFVVWNSQWLSTYWNRQFTNRFFHSDNMGKVFDLGYISTVIRVYFFEFVILGVWFVVTDAWKQKKNDPLFLYFLFYCFFNTLAFLLIKKDSTQHMTGFLVTGAIFVAEALWSLWKQLGTRRLWAVPASLLVVVFAYWIWFFVNADYNPDMWTKVKNESLSTKNSSQLPVVVRDMTAESYGLFHTAQWYSQSDKVFFQSDADRLLVGKEVLFLAEKENGQLHAARIIYRKGLN